MRSLLPLLAFFVGTSAAAQNGYLTNAFFPRYWKANTARTISVRVRNSASTAMFSFHVDWRWNNGPVQTGDWVATTGITGNQYWPLDHQIPFNQPAGSGTLKVWVSAPGDTDASNDTLRFPVDVLGNWTEKTVLLEQYTGTWCQFCPNPNATTNTLDADPYIVVAKHHNNDALTNASSTAYWVQFDADYSPSGVMEQEEFGTLQDDAAYDLWSARAEERKQGVSPAVVSINAGFNAWTRLLTVDMATTFTAAVSGNYVVNAYVVEDDVPGEQTAAPAGYIHQQVVRELLGGASGTSGVIPATTSAGGTYPHQYTLTVPEQWNSNNLRIVATVTEVRNGTTFTVNATDAPIATVGMEEVLSPVIAVFPNPAYTDPQVMLRDAGSPVEWRVLTTDGRVVAQQRTAGVSVVLVDGFAALAPGLYVLQVEQNGMRSEHRLVRTSEFR